MVCGQPGAVRVKTGVCCGCRRDIKLENTLLDGAQPQPNVKICDFGYSKNEFVDSRPKTVSGTPDYIAPEVRPRPDQALCPMHPAHPCLLGTDRQSKPVPACQSEAQELLVSVLCLTGS